MGSALGKTPPNSNIKFGVVQSPKVILLLHVGLYSTPKGLGLPTVQAEFSGHGPRPDYQPTGSLQAWWGHVSICRLSSKVNGSLQNTLGNPPFLSCLFQLRQYSARGTGKS